MARSASKFNYRTSMATALLCLAALDAAHAAPAGPGWAAVGQLLQTFDGAGSSKGSKAVAKVGSGPSSLIDYQEMSVRCLGKKDWDSLSATQRTQFIASLKGLVEQRYYPRWRKIFGKGKVTFQDETAQGGDIVVRTKLLLGKKEELLAWRVADQSGAQKIVSLSVSNSDLLERLKSRIKARQQKVGFDALLTWMKGHSGEDMGSSSASALASAGGSRTGSSSIVMPIAAVRSPGLSAGAAASISD